ncbi:MAG: hypothetical protein DIU71_01925 [Proteobacteria bacterium]|nr:MAG: hypothetical protein DIU71_01925 [Pseudomonadota bacterium]
MKSRDSTAWPPRLAGALLLAGLMAGAGGCGGSSSGSGNATPPPGGNTPPPNTPPAQTLTGVFTDSEVVNIGYRTATQEGVTNENGEFSYLEGESVVFFIGELELPPVQAQPVVTPLDIAGTDDLEHPVVVNIARLLQSLDADGDPDTKIQIPATAAAQAFAVDFALPPEQFEKLDTVVNLVANSGSVNTSLVSKTQALEHLSGSLSQLILGTWRFATESSDLVLTFMQNGQYMLAEVDEADGDGQSGIERGVYTWDPATGEVTVKEILWDTNGHWGMSDFDESAGWDGERIKILVDGGGTKAIVTDPEGGEPMTFTRVARSSDGIVGTWVMTEFFPDRRDVSMAVLTFLSDGKYFVAQDGEIDALDGGTAGVEYGEYVWNAATGALGVKQVIVDTNGAWGLSGLEEDDETVQVTREGQRLYFVEGDLEFYFSAVCSGCEIPHWEWEE